MLINSSCSFNKPPILLVYIKRMIIPYEHINLFDQFQLNTEQNDLK
jgi:hypothetical protein